MLEVASLADVGKYAEELLGYLRSTITVEATASVLCVQQVSNLNSKSYSTNVLMIPYYGLLDLGLLELGDLISTFS